MYIVTDKNDIVFHMSETKNYQSNGNVLVDHDTLAIPPVLIKDVFEVSEIPTEVETQKYCYTAEKGFYKNENYKKVYTVEERLSAVEDMMNEMLGF